MSELVNELKTAKAKLSNCHPVYRVMGDAIDRITQLEATIAKLPHVWHRKDGQWVRVAVVPGSVTYSISSDEITSFRVDAVDYGKRGLRCDLMAFRIEAATYLDEDDYLTSSDARHALTDPPTEGNDK